MHYFLFDVSFKCREVLWDQHKSSVDNIEGVDDRK